MISLLLIISSIQAILVQQYTLCLGFHALETLPPTPNSGPLWLYLSKVYINGMFLPKAPVTFLEPISWAWHKLFSRYILLRTNHTTIVLISRPERYPRGGYGEAGVGK